MGEFNLEELASFSDNNVVSKNLYDSQKACVNLICLEEGQTALEDTIGQKVVVVINTGNGSVITGGGEQGVEEGTLILFESDEKRLLKAKTKMTALVTAIPKG
ncbi:hypothetical protein SCALIN_C27_0066 [Candidatus Scalindua japonica]|uniref:Uncharacterized protein n=2 Tax=Candidatus Scalindua japonica TaxID=1284222 RepID=A0A286U0M5_9BACT|nr:hypothetical protein SCALIN_C27_0066 [Candidatus Scalindua japonica]